MNHRDFIAEQKARRLHSAYIQSVIDYQIDGTIYVTPCAARARMTLVEAALADKNMVVFLNSSYHIYHTVFNNTKQYSKSWLEKILVTCDPLYRINDTPEDRVLFALEYGAFDTCNAKE